jgi:hypothetical protein
MDTQKKGNASVKSIGRAFARDVEMEVIKSASLSYAQIAQNNRRLERHYLALLGESSEFSLELRRRIAEQLLEQALLRGCTQQVCRSKLNSAMRVGFTNVERQAHYHLLYAKGAFERGHIRAARKIASTMVEELERSLNKRKSILAGQYLARTREFLISINGGSV